MCCRQLKRPNQSRRFYIRRRSSPLDQLMDILVMRTKYVYKDQYFFFQSFFSPNLFC